MSLEGAERIRTAVRGFAGLCLTSRPPRQRASHRSGPQSRTWQEMLPMRRMGRTLHRANLVPGLMAHGAAGAPAPYRGSAIATRES